MSQGISNVNINGESVIIDEVSTPNVLYIGHAEIASLTSSAVWKIRKIETTSGAIITWADGNDDYDNVWDNRAALAYS
jgi:hypothetical protein